MSVRSVRSMVFVPSGIFVVAASPIAAILPSSINIDLLARRRRFRQSRGESFEAACGQTREGSRTKHRSGNGAWSLQYFTDSAGVRQSIYAGA